MANRKGIQIGVIRGIPIRLHVTFLLVVPFLAWAFGRTFEQAARLAGLPPGAVSGPPWLWGLGVALGLFASVLVHELAHSLYAISRGGKVRSITLLLVGGVSSISEPPRTPGQEAVMALVGPLSSLAIGGALFLGFVAMRRVPAFDLRFAIFYLAQLNVFLGVFNLLPAFPMDGGRILRGVLAGRLGALRATRIAARVGKAFALIFAAVGAYGGNPFLLVIALLVFVGADAEARDVAVRSALGDLRVAELMERRVPVVTGAETVQSVAERMARQQRLSFPVVEGEAIAGEVTLDAVSRVPPAERPTVAVREVMRPAPVVSPDDPVTDALSRFPNADRPVAVAEAGRLVGTLSRAAVTRALELRRLAHPR